MWRAKWTLPRQEPAAQNLMSKEPWYAHGRILQMGTTAPVPETSPGWVSPGIA